MKRFGLQVIVLGNTMSMCFSFIIMQVRKLDKVVLVRIGENTRPVHFSTVITDTKALIQAVRVAFEDILQPGQEFFLQLKSQEWWNAFLDLHGYQEIPDRSIVKVVMNPVTKVSSYIFVLFLATKQRFLA